MFLAKLIFLSKQNLEEKIYSLYWSNYHDTNYIHKRDCIDHNKTNSMESPASLRLQNNKIANEEENELTPGAIH